MENLIVATNLNKTFDNGGVKTVAVNNISFNIKKGEFAIILGPSGAGKTTILNLLGGMDKVTSGSLIVNGQNVSKMNDKALTNYRRTEIGFVFQFYNLMPNLTALENVELATEVSKKHLNPKEVLKAVGLGDKFNNFPAQLSGGQQQRVAIARALAKNPSLLLCDEPTGALDSETGKNILKLLKDISQKEKMTVLIVTHNSNLAEIGTLVIKLKNGTIHDCKTNKNPKAIDDIEW